METKKQAKHTPGPWVVQDGQDVMVRNAFEIRLIARCHAGHAQPEREANARLIAAAPELLASLQNVYDCTAWKQIYPELQAQIEAAIAKAEGR